MNTLLDDVTMAAIGFEPDGRGRYVRVRETPPRPGEAIGDMLKACGLADAAAAEQVPSDPR
jgi:hypothetical protein